MISAQENYDPWRFGVTAAHEPIKNWAPIAGRWQFPSPAEAVYASPQQQNTPFGVCVSNVRFSEGDVKVTIKLPKADDGVTAAGSGRILLGYRSVDDHYITAGLGGYGYAYNVTQFDRIQGWRGVALAGSHDNLLGEHPYEVFVRARGQRLTLEVDGVQVLDHVLETPLPQGQLGLFAWGTDRVEFNNASVRIEPGTAFVVMQFSDPYQTLYTDVIEPVIKSEPYKLRVYHAGEVYRPGIILEDITTGIVEAKILIAEITPPNPNVFYELGYAHALKKPTILLAESERAKDLPFDVSGYRCLFYENSIGGKNKVVEGLRKHLDAILQQ
jgi:hypothetical protein